MKLYNLSIILAAAAMTVGCSDSEKDLEPSAPYVNPFDIPADKTDEESVLRRDFYHRNGIHLVLGEVVGEGIDPYGNPYTETIDLGWGLNSRPVVYTITYLDGIENMKIAVKALEDHILPHIAGGDSKPYSVLPVADYKDRNKTEYILSNMRCTMINMGPVLSAEDEEARMTAVKTVLKNIVTQLLNDLEYSAKVPFYDLQGDYAGEYICDFEPSWEYDQDMSIVYEYGFLRYSADWYGDPAYDSFLYWSNDFSDFRELVMNYTEEEVYEMYGEYELIIRKYNTMREIITKAGYTF